MRSSRRVWVATLAMLAATASPARAQVSAPAPAQTRADFLGVLDRPRVPLDAATRSLTRADGYVQEVLTFASEQGERVPALLVQRDGGSGRRPVVIALHGTGGSKEGMRGLLETLAARGFLAVAIDGRFHGERAARSGGRSNAYDEAMLAAYRTGAGHPYLYDTVWDVLRLLDYLETRPDVDPARIGVIGNSKGGTEAYLAAAADARIAVAIPLIGVQSFGWSLRHGAAWESRTWTLKGAVEPAAAEAGERVNAAFMRKFYDRIAPGLVDRFDGPAILPLIAPRPLLVINGDSDPRTPVAGVRESARAAEHAYAAAGASEKFVLHIQPDAAHEVTPAAMEAAVEWFVRWLRPGAR